MRNSMTNNIIRRVAAILAALVVVLASAPASAHATEWRIGGGKVRYIAGPASRIQVCMELATDTTCKPGKVRSLYRGTGWSTPKFGSDTDAYRGVDGWCAGWSVVNRVTGVGPWKKVQNWENHTVRTARC